MAGTIAANAGRIKRHFCLLLPKSLIRQRVNPRRISFIDAMRWLANAGENDHLQLLAVVVWRPDRHQPRVKKYLNYRYRPMTKPRHILNRRPYLYSDKVK